MGVLLTRQRDGTALYLRIWPESQANCALLSGTGAQVSLLKVFPNTESWQLWPIRVPPVLGGELGSRLKSGTAPATVRTL